MTQDLLTTMALTPIRKLGEYVSLQQNQAGEDYFVVEHPTARAVIARQGAHLISYQPKDQDDLLWCSRDTAFEQGKAIRGGVPICWPWFGPFDSNLLTGFEEKQRPNHGFVRTSEWQLSSYQATEQSCELVFTITDSDITIFEPDFKFQLSLTVTIGPVLHLSLRTENQDSKPIAYAGALHTYLAADMASLKLDGLGERYLDKLDGGAEKREDSFICQADMDRIYTQPSSEQCLVDNNRCTCLTQDGADSSVVWNAGQLAAGMADMHPGAEHEYVCVEAAITQTAVEIAPGQSHTLSQTIKAGNC